MGICLPRAKQRVHRLEREELQSPDSLAARLRMWFRSANQMYSWES